MVRERYQCDYPDTSVGHYLPQKDAHLGCLGFLAALLLSPPLEPPSLPTALFLGIGHA
jgi:hypothetical protein